MVAYPTKSSVSSYTSSQESVVTSALLQSDTARGILRTPRAEFADVCLCSWDQRFSAKLFSFERIGNASFGAALCIRTLIRNLVLHCSKF